MRGKPVANADIGTISQAEPSERYRGRMNSIGRRRAARIVAMCMSALLLLAGCGNPPSTSQILFGLFLIGFTLYAMLALTVAGFGLIVDIRDMVVEARSRARSHKTAFLDSSTVSALAQGVGYTHGPIGRRSPLANLNHDLHLAFTQIGAAARLVDKDSNGERR